MTNRYYKVTREHVATVELRENKHGLFMERHRSSVPDEYYEDQSGCKYTNKDMLDLMCGCSQITMQE